MFSPPPSSDKETACFKLFGYTIPQNEFEKNVAEAYVPFIRDTYDEPMASIKHILRRLLKNRADHPRMERVCLELIGYLHTGTIEKPTSRVKQISLNIHIATDFLRTRAVSCDERAKKQLLEVACVLDMHV